MGFKEREKIRLVPLKKSLFSANACTAGSYNGSQYEFCLADDCSAENLHKSIRSDALEYFRTRDIPWHAGKGEKHALPSTHLCCSQSACVNFWFPFIRDASALRAILSDVGYSVSEVLPFVNDMPLSSGQSPFVAFEWIGKRNYLDELSRGHPAKDETRTRGAHFTSADFAFRFRRPDKRIQIVLGEWKYTESYATTKSLQISKSGTDRLKKVYRKSLSQPDCQIRLPAEVKFNDLFFDPFDQMMRLQLLATAMERERENADVVSVLHIAPRANEDLVNRITSPVLGRVFPERDIHEIQRALVAKDRFRGLFMEELLPMVDRHASDRAWAKYIKLRYGGAR